VALPLASWLYETQGGIIFLRALPLLLAALFCLALAYRYYSAFLAAKVLALDDSRPTPAHTLYDGQNYDPTNRWVLFGHHFAAISGAGPLIGPVLAIQYGYMPGFIWLVAGVCLAGAVQDMLVLGASVRRGGKSLAEIARTELGPTASTIVSAAILFIVIVALAGLGIVVVKALGGESVSLPAGTQVLFPHPLGPWPMRALDQANTPVTRGDVAAYALRTSYVQCDGAIEIPAGSKVVHPNQQPADAVAWGQTVSIRATDGVSWATGDNTLRLDKGGELIIPGSSWGMFTIACTIPIALLVGMYMYRIRPGKIVEASIIGASAVLAVTVLGSWIPESPLHHYFSMGRGTTTLALCTYGFIASVLPVWLLLCPRDYLSSFLKIGTIALLVFGLMLANPVLKAPHLNYEFINGGPTFSGSLFPFVFICIMCGAVSGFHALVSSGTTPKMVDKETQVRAIGYGSMLMEGLVGIVALLSAAALDPVKHYYPINVPLAEAQKYHDQIAKLDRMAGDPLHRAGVLDPHQLPVADRDLADIERMVGGEALRGRTGGAVTLAVGMSVVFTDALSRAGLAVEGLVKYWYHFAIMFEALFILTTIDAGTRIARFLLQEILGRAIPQLGKTDWMPGAILTTLAVTAAWGILIHTGSIGTIWPMFGIANQLLAVVALALITTLLVNTGRGRYAWVTIGPMLFVMATTLTAGWQLVFQQFPGRISKDNVFTPALNIGLTAAIITMVLMVILMAVSQWVAVGLGLVPTKSMPAKVVAVQESPVPEDPIRR
jgi:carbon starvation protein